MYDRSIGPGMVSHECDTNFASRSSCGLGKVEQEFLGREADLRVELGSDIELS